jgi:hypothetical protein
MKNTPHIENLKQRVESDPRAQRRGRNFPQVTQDYQSANLVGNCGTPAKFCGEPAFFRLSNEYFADEAARSFAADAGVFAALLLTSVLPIVSGVDAIATLIHCVGVL